MITKYIFKFILLISLVFTSCSDPSSKIFNSTIELMGNEYGPGYAITGSMEGRSHWMFNEKKLKIKYSAYNKFTGNVSNATEENELTNFKRYVYFDDNEGIPPTWSVYADWGTATYWITLKHFSKNEYNGYFDDVKRSSKDQWGLIHNLEWGSGARAKWMNYVTEESSKKLIEIFRVDTSTEQYKIELKEYLDEKEEKEKEEKESRIELFEKYFKHPLINSLDLLTHENYLFSDDVEGEIEFLIDGESFSLKKFRDLLIYSSEQGFQRIDFNKYVRIFDYYNRFNNVNSFGKRGTSPQYFFKEVIKDIEKNYGSTRNNDHIIFYNVEDERGVSQLKFKFLVNYHKGSRDDDPYLYTEVNSKNFEDFYGTYNPKYRDGTNSFFRTDRVYEKLRFYIYKYIFTFLNNKIDKIKINLDGKDFLGDKVLVFSLDDLSVNTVNEKHLTTIHEWLKNNPKNKD